MLLVDQQPVETGTGRDLCGTAVRQAQERTVLYFAALQGACGKRPSWRMATALPALISPDEHVCVRKSVFIAYIFFGVAGSLAAGYLYQGFFV